MIKHVRPNCVITVERQYKQHLDNEVNRTLLDLAKQDREIISIIPYAYVEKDAVWHCTQIRYIGGLEEITFE